MGSIYKYSFGDQESDYLIGLAIHCQTAVPHVKDHQQEQ